MREMFGSYFVIYVFVSLRICNNLTEDTRASILEGPPQFENLIMAWMYVRSITRSTMYQKSFILLAETGVWKINSVDCGLFSIKIDYSDYQQNK